MSLELRIKVQQALDILFDEYANKNFHIQLLYPSILVRIIPKPEHLISGLYVPDTWKENPVRFAVVLQSWERKEILRQGKTFVVEPTFKRGDLVLLPWWAGQPVPTFHDDHHEAYKIVSDYSIFNHSGQLDAPNPTLILKMGDEQVNLREKLKTLISQFHPQSDVPEIDEHSINNIINELTENFDIMPKPSNHVYG